VGTGVTVAEGVAVAVGVAVEEAVAVGVAVEVGLGVTVAVGVGVGVGVGVATQSMILIVSIRQPAAALLLSLASRHRSTMFWPAAAEGRLTVVVINPPE
jgi:hypothetical protein